MEGVERRRNADFPLPFFSYESICSRRTRGIRRFSEKAAVTRMEFVAFPEKVAVAHMEFVVFPEKVAVTERYLLFFQKK